MRYLNLVKNIDNWWTYFACKYGNVKADPLFFKTRSGVTIEVPRRLLQTFKEIFFEECYMAGLENPRLSSPTVLDIGANAGYFSLFAASRYPGARILSFEPIPANYSLLDRNRKHNKRFNITTFQSAVAGKTGEIRIFLEQDDAFTTSASIIDGDASRKNGISVPCLSLADIFRKNGIERCDLLKMDCEGAEYDILYNCPDSLFSRISQMALEVHNQAEPSRNIDSLEAFLKSKGYGTRQRPVGMMWAWRKD